MTTRASWCGWTRKTTSESSPWRKGATWRRFSAASAWGCRRWVPALAWLQVTAPQPLAGVPPLGTRLLPKPKLLPSPVLPSRFPKPRPLEGRPHPYPQAPRTRTGLQGVLKPRPLRIQPSLVRSGPCPKNRVPPGFPDPPSRSPTPTDILTPCPSDPCPGCGRIWGHPQRWSRVLSPYLRLRRYSRKPATRSCGTSTWATCSPAHLTWAPGCVEACMSSWRTWASTPSSRRSSLACACRSEAQVRPKFPPAASRAVP